MEYLIFFIFGYADTCIPDIQTNIPVYLLIPHFNNPLDGIFDSVSYKIHENLRQAVLIQTDDTSFIRIHGYQTDLRISNTLLHDSSQFIKIDSQIKLFILQLYRAGFYFRKIQNIINQLQKQFVISINDLDVLFFFFIVVCHHQQVRETDDSV